MVMTYDGALVMPKNYAIMSEEEMTYTDGGAIGVPRAAAAVVIDAALLATPLGAAFAPFKYMGKAAAKALLTKYAGSIAGKLGWCITKLGLAGGSFAVNFTAGQILGMVDTICSCATSLGGIISVALDCMDNDGLNGWIGEKMW